MDRRDAWLTAATSTALFVLYALTCAPGVTVEDSSDFIMGIGTLGIVHPPGYPLYTMLGHLFTRLPLGSLPHAVNLFSALWGALTGGLLFQAFRWLGGSRQASLFLATSVGLASVLWAQAVVAEVYTMNAFFVASLLVLLLRYDRSGEARWLYAACFVTGLGLSHHHPLLIVSWIGLAFLIDWKSAWRRLGRAGRVHALLCFGLGLTPVLYLVVQAYRPDLTYNCGMLPGLRGALGHLLLVHYTREFGATLADAVWLGWGALATLARDFPLPALLAAFGAVQAFRSRWRYRWAFAVGLGSTTLLLANLLGFRDSLPHHAFLRNMLQPALLFASGFALHGLASPPIAKLPFRVALPVFSLALLTQAWSNFPLSSHHDDRLVEHWAKALYQTPEPDSILILCGGTNAGAIYYFHLMEGLRPDLTVFDRGSVFTRANPYGGRLFATPDPAKLRRQTETELIRTSPRHIYYDCQAALREIGRPMTLTPLLYRAQGLAAPGPLPELTLSDAFFDAIFRSHPVEEYFLDDLRKGVSSNLMNYYALVDSPQLDRLLAELRASRFYRDTDLLLQQAHNMKTLGKPELALELYRQAEAVEPKALDAVRRSEYCDLLERHGGASTPSRTDCAESRR